MKKIVTLSFAGILLFIIVPRAVVAFQFAKEEYSLSESIPLVEAVKGNYYYIYNPDDIVLNGQFCAKVSGEELLDSDRNLKHYGTCFSNDHGEFQILELSDNLSGSYDELLNSEYLVGQRTVSIP